MIRTRLATPADVPTITEIYNEAILTTTATFDTEPKSVAEQRAWFAEHGPRYPVMVAETGGQVAAWASLSRWSGRCAYADTAEVSLYVWESRRGQGIGRCLMGAILREGKQAGLHSILARVAGGNAASIRLHQAFGFELAGVMRQVGRKFGRLLDIHLLQLIYAEVNEATLNAGSKQNTGDNA